MFFETQLVIGRVDPISEMGSRHAKELLLIVNNCTAVGHASNEHKPKRFVTICWIHERPIQTGVLCIMHDVRATYEQILYQ